MTVEAGAPHDRDNLRWAIEGEPLWRIRTDLLGGNSDQVGRCDLQKPQADRPGQRAALHHFDDHDWRGIPDRRPSPSRYPQPAKPGTSAVERHSTFPRRELGLMLAPLR